MRHPILLAVVVVMSLLMVAPALRAEVATEVEMERVCENWLQFMVDQREMWAGDPHPRISAVSNLYDGNQLLARVYSVYPQGYVVVPILKELPPVKTYSETSEFDTGQAGGFVQLIRDVLSDRLRLYAETYGSLDARQGLNAERVFGEVNREEWDRLLSGSDSRAPLTEVGPLVTTAWHQGGPYNNFCPTGDGGRCVVGCVATGAVQVMRYHAWPPSGVGSYSYTWDGDQSCGGNVGGGLLTAGFSDPYDWANMPNNCGGGCTPAQEDALAELNYEVGVAFDMDYGACGSGTYTFYAVDVFPAYFRYEPDIDRENRSDHTPESWFAIIKGEINSDRPMMYRISGHCIVCDGWRDTGGTMQYHMNYGWADSHNAWYVLDNLYMSPDPNDEFVIRRIIPENRKVLVRADGLGDYPTIQNAINSVGTGYIIELDDGTYTGADNRDLDFGGKELIIRSLNGDPDLCVIDCQDLGRGFYLHSGEGSAAMIRGVTITNGYASGSSPADKGGAIYCDGVSVVIENCKITLNEADGDGGGICCDSSSVLVTGCVISNNTSGALGGGICFDGTSSPTVDQTAVNGNSAQISGGGIAGSASVSVSITACTIAGNSTAASGAGNGGGGLFLQSLASLEDCAIHGNSSAAEGGGVFFALETGTEPWITSCTIARNSAAGTGGGLQYEGDSSPLIQQTILWGNCAGTSGDELYFSGGPVVRFACSDVDSSGIEGSGTVDWLWYNLYLVPGFCDPRDCASAPTTAGNYHLKDVSPCAPGNAPLVCGLIGALDVGCTSNVVSVHYDGSGDYPTIQAAINAIPSYDVVELSNGTFTGPGNRDIDFAGKAVTVRSQSGSADSSVIDCQGLGRAFHFHSGEGSAAQVQNVTLANGHMTDGGAIRCESSCPTISGCVIRGNTADQLGGGLLCTDGSSPAIENCTFPGNSATSGGGVYSAASSPVLTNTIIVFGTTGEAVGCDGTGSASLSCCDVYGNAGGDWVGCIAGQNGADGNFSSDPLFCDPAGLDFQLYSNSPCADAPDCGLVGALPVGCFGNRVWNVPGDVPTIQAGIDSAAVGDTVLVSCGTFYEHAIVMKSGIVVRSETGVADCAIIDAQQLGRIFTCLNVDSTASIEGLTLTGGLASGAWPANAGGAIYCESASPRIVDCVFYNNSANYGGALACRAAAPDLVGCTLAHNAASSSGGGVYSYNFSAVDLDRCIIAFSTQGHSVYCQSSGTATLTCCDVYGNAAGDWVGCISGQEGSNGNFSMDPEFCNSGSGDYTIAAVSPCAPDNSPAGCDLIGALGVDCAGASVADMGTAIPASFYLAPNVPNPFNPVTEISYGIPAAAGTSPVLIRVYDATGRRVRTLVDSEHGPGAYNVTWDGTDKNGAEVASGVYFYRITWSGKSETRRMVLLK
ncbi:MAG: C10 family peptidase [Candidatus Eisenbacteria sp.]|nr:C10 family peptidase [Candidatus Eisenbacteria bacterium]